MSIALVVVKKTLGGHTWSNTHGIQIGADNSLPPVDADLVTAGAAGPFDAAHTGATGATTILQAILAFERLLHDPSVVFTNMLVTDAKRNVPGGSTNEYASIALNLPGAAPSGATTVDPGGITLMLHRTPVGFGHKPGRLFLRGALGNNAAIVGGPRMMQWSGAGVITVWNTNMSAALASGISGYFNGGANAATALYGLPLYVTPRQYALSPAGPKVGSLVGMLPIGSITMVGPVLRQVQRGRKRKKV